jgi:hypothetical protein
VNHYLWWIPLAIIYYAVLAWSWKKVNDYGTINWILMSYAIGALCPIWIIVAKYSKRLMFDGMLYDVIMFMTFVLVMIFLGTGNKFELHNWIGVGLVALGFILMRIGV